MKNQRILAVVLISLAIVVAMAAEVVAIQTHNRWWTALDIVAVVLLVPGVLLAWQIAKPKADEQ